MASDEDYHSESEFYYPDETENNNEKENIGSLATWRKPSKCWIYNGQCAKVCFNTTNGQHSEKINVWKRFFLEVGETRKIEVIPADELNILICRFMTERKKKDDGVYELATLQSFRIQRSLQRYLNDKNS